MLAAYPQSRWLTRISLLISLCLGGMPAGAGQASAELKVVVTGADAAAPRVFCSSTARPGSFGATVTVVCSTGALASIAGPERFTSSHGGAYQYLLQLRSDGGGVAEMVALPGADAGAAWRIVRLGDQEYVEFTLAW